MARRENPKTTIKLLPTAAQRAALDDTWGRLGRLMNIAQDAMLRTGEIGHVLMAPVLVERLQATEDGERLGVRLLHDCVRTVSRHLYQNQEDLEAARIDWRDPPAPVHFSVKGRSAAVMSNGSAASIVTAAGRQHVAFDLLEGDAKALHNPEHHFCWFRDAVGDHFIQRRPYELQEARQRARQTPVTRARVGRIRTDLRRRKILELMSIDIGATQPKFGKTQ